MRTLAFLLVAAIPTVAQNPLVRLINTTHPASTVFEVGDRFEILVTGAPNQPVSVRTTMENRVDWSPVIGSTDSTGRWSTAGQFEKTDFGGWREVWTVGGKLASPSVEFSVSAPCLPGGDAMALSTGLHMELTCETAEGRRTFSTPPESGSFRSPDGRLVAGRSAEQTQEAYQMEILEFWIAGNQPLPHPVSLQTSSGSRGDGTAELIANLVGVNALSNSEIRNVLAIIHDAFEKPETIAPAAKYPLRTVNLLHHLADFTDDTGLQREIAETVAYVQTR